MRHLLVGVAFFGGLSAALSPLPAQSWILTGAPTTNYWGSIACSADGSKLAAGVGQYSSRVGAVYLSRDSGATWTTAGVPVGLWCSVASSANGTTLVAGDFLDGFIFTSDDSGANWRSNEVPREAWRSLACSGDGTRLVAAGLYSLEDGSPGHIYTSSDSGRTWRLATAPSGRWVSVASSGDGSRLVASDDSSSIWVWIDGGADFRLAFTDPGQNWTSVACSADGSRMAAGSNGGALVTSADSGATWKSNAMPGGFSIWFAAGYSADGSRLAAEGVPPFAGTYTPGIIFVSSDSGASWVQTPTNGLSHPAMDWTGIAMSADGCKLAGAVTAFSGTGSAPSPGGIFTLQFTPAPALAIARSSGSLVLSWIVPSANFVLQQGPDLATTNWADVAGTPVLDYSTLRNQVTIPPPARPMFYRLISR